MCWTGGQLQRFADLLRDHEGVRPFDFAVGFFRCRGCRAVDWLFATCKHQFGFWTPYNGVWQTSTFATWQGERLKGSDYCFAAMHRVLRQNPNNLTATGHARLRWQDVEGWFRDDDKQNPHAGVGQPRAVGPTIQPTCGKLGWDPAELVRQAREQARPVTWLLQRLDLVRGTEKTHCARSRCCWWWSCSIVLSTYFSMPMSPNWRRLSTTHLMRSCLRTGLVRVVDPLLRERLVARKLLTPAEEWAVRVACYDAVRTLARLSGQSLAAIDWFFFGARRRCPEQEAPDATSCPLIRSAATILTCSNPYCARQLIERYLEVLMTAPKKAKSPPSPPTKRSVMNWR